MTDTAVPKPVNPIVPPNTNEEDSPDYISTHDPVYFNHLITPDKATNAMPFNYNNNDDHNNNNDKILDEENDTATLKADQLRPCGDYFRDQSNTFDPQDKKFIGIYYQNVNGLGIISNDATKLREFYEGAAKVGADIFMANETKIDTTNTRIRGIINKTTNDYWRNKQQSQTLTPPINRP